MLKEPSTSIPITAVLARLCQDLAEILRPDMIRSACDEAGYQWPNRLLDPCRALFFAFSASGAQRQHRVPACRSLRRLRFQCLGLLPGSHPTAAPRAPDSCRRESHHLSKSTDGGSNWLGYRVGIEDGSSVSMSDKSVLRDHFGQPTGQRLGCGFRSRNGSLFSILSPACFYALTWFLEIADSVRTDTVPILVKRRVHAVFRLHQRQLVDFTPGLPCRRRRVEWPISKGCLTRFGSGRMAKMITS